jgi:hypothetical protein
MKSRFKKSWKVQSLILGLGLALPQASLALSNFSATMDTTNLNYSFSYSGAPTYFHIFIDADKNASTGFANGGIGAEYMIENGVLYKFSGTSASAWSWTAVTSSNMVNAAPNISFKVARTVLANPTSLNVMAATSAGDSSGIVVQNLPTTTATTWTFCANENATCTFSGTKQVRYGAGSSYVTKTLTGPVACNNSVFGDPIRGVVKHCDIASSTTAPASSPTPTPTPTPVATSSPFVKPTLVNPVSPIQYGAKCDGVTDDSAAFQSAISASDVLVPAGKTCVINHPVQVVASNRHLECGTGSMLKQTVSVGRMFNYSAPSAARSSGNSIVNCHFFGTNTLAPQANWNDSGLHFNIPVQTNDRVDNFFLAGNTFERFWGQSMFQTYGAVDGGTGDQIIYNTFKSCGYYGPVFTAHKNGRIANNTMVDCAAGVENDNSTQFTGGIIIENNSLSCIYGYGGPDMGACTMLTGGATSNGADYRTNIVRNNTIQGVSSSSGFQGAQGSRLIGGASWGALSSQYSNNTCNNGCTFTP